MSLWAKLINNKYSTVYDHLHHLRSFTNMSHIIPLNEAHFEQFYSLSLFSPRMVVLSRLHFPRSYLHGDSRAGLTYQSVSVTNESGWVQWGNGAARDCSNCFGDSSSCFVRHVVRAPATTAGLAGTTIPFPYVRRLSQHRLPSHLYALRTPPLSPIFHEWVIYWFQKRCLITRVARHRSRAASQYWDSDNPDGLLVFRQRMELVSQQFPSNCSPRRRIRGSARHVNPQWFACWFRNHEASFVLRDPHERYRKVKISASKGLEI